MYLTCFQKTVTVWPILKHTCYCSHRTLNVERVYLNEDDVSHWADECDKPPAQLAHSVLGDDASHWADGCQV